MPAEPSQRRIRNAFPRRRAVFVLTYSCAILSVATVSWAILSWQGVANMDSGNFGLAPRLLFAMAAVLTMGLALWGLRYIEENDLYLFREEALPLVGICFLLTLFTMWETGKLASEYLDANGIGANYVPRGLGALLALYFLVRLSRLYEMPSRTEMAREPRTIDPWYSAGLAFLGLVVWIAGYLAAEFFGLSSVGPWLPMLLGGLLALVFVFGLRQLFRPGIALTPASAIMVEVTRPSPDSKHRKLTAASSTAPFRPYAGAKPGVLPEDWHARDGAPAPSRLRPAPRERASAPPAAPVRRNGRTPPADVEPARQVLFICSGNIYRSRFAEAIFNHRAEQDGLPWRAFSRGLAVHLVDEDISQHTVEALRRRGISLEMTAAERQELTQADFENAAFVVALNEEEHRPMLRARFAEWENQVEFWQVHDVDAARPAQALAVIEALVGELGERLAEDRTQAKI